MKMKEYLAQSALQAAKKRKAEKGTVRGEIDYSGGAFGFGKAAERVHEGIVNMIGPGTLDKKVKPGFVPVGLDSSLFTLNKKNLNAGQIIRRNYLDTFAPRLQKAVSKRDIFAYNDALSSLRVGVSRTTGGPKLAKEMPDPIEARRQARLRQQRMPTGSRAQTLGFF